MVQQLTGRWTRASTDVPAGLELRPWREEDLNAAARLISTAYEGASRRRDQTISTTRCMARCVFCITLCVTRVAAYFRPWPRMWWSIARAAIW